MIRLTKGAIPQILAQNAIAWTKVLTDHLHAGTQPSPAEKSRYGHPKIKAALIAETVGKCAYCESKLRHITYGDVEHITPKSVDVTKTFDWQNLTLACDVCNTKKGDHFGNHEDLVDPYTTNPEDHFTFAGANILSKPGDGPALITESTLQLNRLELLERRSERLHFLHRQLHLLTEVTDPNKKAVIRRDLETHEVKGDKEFSGMAKAYIEQALRRIDGLS